MNHRILIKSQNHVYLINRNDIVFCKSDNCYTNIFLNDGRSLLVSQPLMKFAKELDSNEFIRISQSYIVAVRSINCIDKKRKIIKLNDDSQIPYTLVLKDLLSKIQMNMAGELIQD